MGMMRCGTDVEELRLEEICGCNEGGEELVNLGEVARIEGVNCGSEVDWLQGIENRSVKVGR